jgi:hypothetical protein
MQIDQEQEELNKLLNTQKDRRMVNISEDQKLISFETFKVSHKMNLVQQEAAHILLIDSQLPIDCLMIQSMQNVDIIEVKDNVCKINKINDKITNNALLATLKVQGEDSNVTRVEIKLRTSEGQTGNLQVFVMPKNCTTC